jgi:D-sedoheptulose 7-phosphate isomerase
MTATTSAQACFLSYVERLNQTLAGTDWGQVEQMAHAIRDCWAKGRRVFLCGNGGSSANAVHVANDFLYGTAKGVLGAGVRVTALPANVAVLTCLANDQGYAEIFSRQLAVDGQAGDILIVFSGSGNSANIVEALKQASGMGIQSFAVLGYSGGKAKELADVPIHFPINDMQISEDLQMILTHMIMQWLSQNRPAGE